MSVSAHAGSRAVDDAAAVQRRSGATRRFDGGDVPIGKLRTSCARRHVRSERHFRRCRTVPARARHRLELRVPQRSRCARALRRHGTARYGTARLSAQVNERRLSIHKMSVVFHSRRGAMLRRGDRSLMTLASSNIHVSFDNTITSDFFLYYQIV